MPTWPGPWSRSSSPGPAPSWTTRTRVATTTTPTTTMPTTTPTTTMPTTTMPAPASTPLRRTDMDIDLAALRALERERDISLDILIPAIEQALLVAYHRTEGAHRNSRVELDRKTGHVIVWA